MFSELYSLITCILCWIDELVLAFVKILAFVLSHDRGRGGCYRRGGLVSRVVPLSVKLRRIAIGGNPPGGRGWRLSGSLRLHRRM